MINKILNKIFKKKKFVKNFSKFCRNKPGFKALLYYKTEPFFWRYKESYKHTNNWEILEITKILNKFGFSVDIIDRAIDEKFIPEDKYDLFIGNAAGNSGKYYTKYAKKLTKAVKIFFAAGPDPKISNELIYERYNYLKERRKINYNLKPRRTIDNNGNTKEAMQHTNYIFAVANKFSLGTYKQYNKKMFTIHPSSSPEIKFDYQKLYKKNKKNFLYFGGSGNIVKGLDLLLDAFSELDDLTLYICAPKNEEEFNEIYKKTWENKKNINFIGFVDVGNDKFNELTSKCGFVLLPSCSEGIVTSGTTCMRIGLIPVATFEAGIDMDNFGFFIKDISPEAIKKQLVQISQISTKDFKKRIIDTHVESYKYTQQGFSKSFEKALLNTMLENNLI